MNNCPLPKGVESVIASVTLAPVLTQVLIKVSVPVGVRSGPRTGPQPSANLLLNFDQPWVMVRPLLGCGWVPPPLQPCNKNPGQGLKPC